MLNDDTKSIINHYENMAKIRDEFYNNKRYVTGLDRITGYIDNQSYDDDVWNDDIDELFDFLYDNGGQVDFFNNENTINIKYNNKYYSLCQMHGQGCYRSFDILEEKPDSYIDFEDIIIYYNFSKLPYNVSVLQLIYRGFESIKVTHGSTYIEINGERFNLDEVFEDLIGVLDGKESI